MNMTDIKNVAKEHGVKIGRLNKEELIHAIQKEEGNFECFATAANGYCDQMGCFWRDDCLVASRTKAS